MFDLIAALKAAKPGDTIALPTGTYTGLAFRGINFAAPGVTITSADPTRPAILTNFNIGINGESCSGLAFTRLDMQVLTPNWSGFNIYGSQRITFDRVHVYGPAGAPDANVQAVNFFDSAYIAFTNSEVEQVSHGVSFARSDHITVTGNNIHNVNSDTLDFTQDAYVLVSGNALHDFYPTDGNHPDAIQFGTYGSTVASHDITISDNLIYRGAGQNSQGIFMRDEVGTLPYQNVTITNNLIVGTGSSGLRPIHAASVTIAGNDLVTLSGGDPTTLLVQNSDQIVWEGNAGVSMSVTAVNGNTNIVEGHNTTTSPVTQAAADATIAAWYAAHTGAWATTPPPINPPPPDPLIARVAKLETALTAIIVDAAAGKAAKPASKDAHFTTIAATATTALAP